jgi:hypothetical protein
MHKVSTFFELLRRQFRIERTGFATAQLTGFDSMLTENMKGSRPPTAALAA